MASVFTKIINGELPSYKILEDETVIAILALDQVNLGHVIVIPKAEINHWHEVPTDIYNSVGTHAQKIAKAITKATGCPRVVKMAVGFEVPHYHLHLIPAWSIAEVDFKLATKRSREEMTEIQSKIISFLR